MKKVIKRSGDLPARYGGEEFAIVVSKVDIQGAITIANRLLEEIRSLQIPHLDSQVASFVTVSIDISSQIPEIKTNFETLIANADKALYQAKKEGRNRYSIY